MNQLLLLCDWGNSSFRLALYDVSAKMLIDELQTAQGVAVVYRGCQNKSLEGYELGKENLYRKVLLQQVEVLAGRTGLQLKNTAIVISGMASSSIGIAELPYATIPFKLDGSQSKTMYLPASSSFPHPIVLISGVQANNEVMRGEETQLVGIWSLLSDTGNKPGEAIVILPGTHSKHIFVKQDQLLRFSTFMTGELYQLLAMHSILKDAVTFNETADVSGQNEQAFRMGLQQSNKTVLSNSLFIVRTNQLFKRWTETENSFFLSGLLIGTELQSLRDNPAHPIILCSSRSLIHLYSIALNELGFMQRTFVVPAELVEKAAMVGQQIIFSQHFKQRGK